MTQNTSRRRFLKVAAATGAVAGLNATVLAQGQDEQYILLGGKVAGWQGFRMPGQAEAGGSANPTLNLEAGTTYTLMWQNLDGQPHNFAIQNSNGDYLQVLNPISVQQDEFQQLNESAQGGGNATQMAGNETGGNQTTAGSEELVEQTEILSEQGAVQGVRFTATEEMATYICPVHPNSMVGDISLGGGGGGGANNSSM